MNEEELEKRIELLEKQKETIKLQNKLEYCETLIGTFWKGNSRGEELFFKVISATDEGLVKVVQIEIKEDFYHMYPCDKINIVFRLHVPEGKNNLHWNCKKITKKEFNEKINSVLEILTISSNKQKEVQKK